MNAKKVVKRSWSFERFKQSCAAEAKRIGVKLNATKLKAPYDDGAGRRRGVQDQIALTTIGVGRAPVIVGAFPSACECLSWR